MKWKCEHCGYEWTGDVPPNFCPNCGKPKEQFEQE